MAKRTPATGIRLHGKTYYLNVTREGKRHWINLETKDFSEAVKKAAQIRSNPELLAPLGITAEIEKFIAYQLRMQEYTEHTARTKKNKLKLLAAFLPEHASVRSITTTQLQNWHDTLLETVETSTIHGYMMAARAFLRWGQEVAKLRHTQPMNGVRLVKSEGRARSAFCTYEQRDKLIAECEDAELKFILFCGFHGGLRLNEIIQARPFWFDLPGKRLVLRQTATMKFKDREERTIPMTVAFHAYLKQFGLHDPFMIKPDVEQGRWLYRYDPRTKFMAYMRDKKLPWVTPHVMRHTFASLLVSAGESIYKVAVWMGDNVDTVQKHYGHLAPDNGGIEKAFSQGPHLEGAQLTALPGKSPASKRSQAASNTLQS